MPNGLSRRMEEVSLRFSHFGLRVKRNRYDVQNFAKSVVVIGFALCPHAISVISRRN
jgi:hypothetical protein